MQNNPGIHVFLGIIVYSWKFITRAFIQVKIYTNEDLKLYARTTGV